MIGGVDVIFRTTLPAPQALDAAVRVVRQRWPAAVFQSGASGVPFSGYTTIPFSSEREILIYQDRAAFESWEEQGVTAENENRMVHLLFPDGQALTVVVGDDTVPAMRSVLESIRHSLLDRSLRMPPFAVSRARDAA